MKLEDIKVGDTVYCSRTTEAHMVTIDPVKLETVAGKKGVSTFNFYGKVEDIRGDLLLLDNPAQVRFDKVVRVMKVGKNDN